MYQIGIGTPYQENPAGCRLLKFSDKRTKLFLYAKKPEVLGFAAGDDLSSFSVWLLPFLLPLI